MSKNTSRQRWLLVLVLNSFWFDVSGTEGDLRDYLSSSLDALAKEGRPYSFRITVSFHPVRWRTDNYTLAGYVLATGATVQGVAPRSYRRSEPDWCQFDYQGRSVIRQYWAVDLCIASDLERSLPLPNEILQRLGPHLLNPSRIVERETWDNVIRFDVDYGMDLDSAVLGVPAVLEDGEYLFESNTKLIFDFKLSLAEKASKDHTPFPVQIQGSLDWDKPEPEFPAEITRLLGAKQLFESLSRVPQLAEYARRSPLVPPPTPPVVSAFKTLRIRRGPFIVPSPTPPFAPAPPTLRIGRDGVIVPFYEVILARSEDAILAIRMLFATEKAVAFEYWYWDDGAKAWRAPSEEEKIVELFERTREEKVVDGVNGFDRTSKQERRTLDFRSMSVLWSMGGQLWYENYLAPGSPIVEYANSRKLAIAEVDPFDPQLKWASKGK